jgi:hypothetical protein
MLAGCIAVAEQTTDSIFVFKITGEFVRHVGVGALHQPYGVVASDLGDELVVTEYSGRIVVLSASGDVLHATESGFTGVAVLDGAVYAQTCGIYAKCVVLV